MDLYYGFIKTSTLLNNIKTYANKQQISFQNVVYADYLQEKDLKNIKPNSTIITPDVSILGKNFEEIIKTIKLLYKNNINLTTIKENISLNKPQSVEQTLDLALALRRSLLSIQNKAIQEGLKNKGRPQGRPTGIHNKTTKLDGKKEIIINYLKQQIPKSEIAKKLNVGRTTLFMYLRQLEL